MYICIFTCLNACISLRTLTCGQAGVPKRAYTCKTRFEDRQVFRFGKVWGLIIAGDWKIGALHMGMLVVVTSMQAIQIVAKLLYPGYSAEI